MVLFVRRMMFAALVPGFLSYVAWGATLESPFPSDVTGLTIPNAHEMIRGPGRVIRGNAPNQRVGELIDLGITDVLMFKTPNDVPGTDTNDLAVERVAIEQAARAANRDVNVHWIPFAWRDVRDPELACRQLVQGLRLIEEVAKDAHRSLFFHCTVGEDRTGMLAGLSRMIHQGWSKRGAFQNEMCAHGYERGNPGKPDFVVQTIRRELTPIYLRMAGMIETGRLSAKKLNESVCRGLIERPLPTGTWECEAQPVPATR